VKALVIDAGIALKWVVWEAGTEAALALRLEARLIAPEILLADCASLLCKKAARGELVRDEALLAARLLQAAGVELVPTRPLLEAAMLIALDLQHPVHDCIYIALAAARNCRLVTADPVLVRSVAQRAQGAWSDHVLSLADQARAM
jgi:predicted nucleic acid-binding protein